MFLGACRMQLGKILPASGSLAAFSIFYCVGGAQQPRLVPAHSTTTPPSCARVRIHAHTRAHTRAERHTRLADMKRLVNVIDLGLTTLAFTVAILAQGTSWAVAVTQAFLSEVRFFLLASSPHRSHTSSLSRHASCRSDRHNLFGFPSGIIR